MLYLISFYRVHALHRPQTAWVVARVYNGMFLFISGWLAFLVAAESNDSRFMAAWVANSVFVGGGLVLIFTHVGLGAANIVFDNQLTKRYRALRAALVALEASLGGRTPTLLDFLPVQAPAQAFSAAADRSRPSGIAMVALTGILALSCAIVNLGGLALARRLHLQIRESVELLALVDTTRFATTTAAAGGAQETLAPLPKPVAVDFPRARGDSLGAIAAPLAFWRRDGGGSRRGSGDSDATATTTKEHADERKSSLTLFEVKQLARMRDASGREPAGRMQARKVLELKKAERDLTVITSSVLVITTLLLGAIIYITYGTAKDAVTGGNWGILELNATLCNWIYSFFVCLAIGYVNYNSLFNGRRARPQPSASHAQTQTRPGAVATTRTVDSTAPLDATLEEEEEEGCPPGRRTSRAQKKKSWLGLQPGSRNHSFSSAGGGGGRGDGTGSAAASIVVTVETSQVCDEEDELGALWWDKVEGNRGYGLPGGRRETHAAWNERVGDGCESAMGRRGSQPEGWLEEA
ncbi:hypothetical protein JCM10449v2_000036 [Rhodotorula kratochvilovae]